MLDDYKFKSPTDKITIELEKEVIEILLKMEKHTKIGKAEIVNVAMKRFITQHKDFLPKNQG